MGFSVRPGSPARQPTPSDISLIDLPCGGLDHFDFQSLDASQIIISGDEDLARGKGKLRRRDLTEGRDHGVKWINADERAADGRPYRSFGSAPERVAVATYAGKGSDRRGRELLGP